MPGDYNLVHGQQLEDRGEPAWIGNCDQLNACRSTDAYEESKASGRAWLLELLIFFFGAFLNAVISSFSLKSRRSLLVSVVLPTRSECFGVGFASAVFESDNVPFAIHSKFHGAVFHWLMTDQHLEDEQG